MITLTRTLTAVAALTLAVPFVPHAVAAQPPTPVKCTGSLPASQVSAIRKIAESALQEQHISGLTVGIGRNGNVIFGCGYGLRDRAHQLPSDADTVYPIGSITKQFTATAVMLLAQDGKVDIDAPVARYLPTAPHAKEVTVRNLLNQTSGLDDYIHHLPLKDWSSPRFDLSPKQYARMVAGTKLGFKPGTKWQYSNTNYLLLGMLVSKVSGQPYATFLHQRILAPNHLTTMQYLTHYAASAADSSRPYDYKAKHFVALTNIPMGWANSAGALASTAADLIRWDGAFFNDRILDADGVRSMTTPPNIPMERTRMQALLRGYAFGWVDGRDHGRTVIWHNGGLPGARAMNATFPHNGLEVIVLTNASTAAPEKIALAIAGAVGE